MSPDDSVSHWLSLLQSDGDAAAAQRLWERYFHRLVGLALAKLQGQPPRSGRWRAIRSRRSPPAWAVP